MKKYLVIDSRMDMIFKEYFLSLGYILMELPISNNTYSEISAHVDIFCSKIADKIIFEKSVYDIFLNDKRYSSIMKMENILCGKKKVSAKYPDDIAYNVSLIGNNVIHNFKFTDAKVMQIIKSNNLNCININQGYSKCSIANICNNSCIVTDKKIHEILTKNGIDTLLLEKEPNIKLLAKSSYSKMKGFIGGATCIIDSKFIIFGDLKYTNNAEKIREFVDRNNVELVHFSSHELVDYGSAIEIIEGD